LSKPIATFKRRSTNWPFFVV